MTAKAPSRGRKRRLLVWLLIALIATGVIGWFARKPLAGFVGQQYCSAKDLSCSFDVTQLDLSGIEIRNLAISSETAPNIINANTIRVALDWPEFATPEPRLVEVDAPRLVAAFDDEGLSLGGLERLIPKPRADKISTSSPDIQITSGQVELNTPAGMLKGQFQASGNLATGGSAAFTLDAVDLSRGDQRLSLQSAELQLSKDGGIIFGKLDVRLAALAFEDMRAEAIVLQAGIPDASKFDLIWEARVGLLERSGELSIVDLQTSGTANFSPAPLRPSPQLNTLSMIAATGPAAWSGHSVEAASFELSAAQKRGDKIEIALETELLKLTSEALSGETLSLSFNGETDQAFSLLSGGGNLLAASMSLNTETRARAFKDITAGAPFKAHASALRSALNRAVSDFTLGTNYRIDAEPLDDWRLILTDAIAVRSASGLNAVLTPHQGRPALIADTSGVTISGVAALDGGGAPSLSADITQIILSGVDVTAQTGGLTLKPWRVDQTTIAAKLNAMELQKRGSDMQVSTVGELNLDGIVLGARLDNARLFGGVDAVRTAGAWRVQTHQQECLGFRLGGAQASGGLTLQAVNLNLCPEGGRFIQHINGQPTGQINLGDVTLPFSTREVIGKAGLRGTIINWRAGDTLSLSLTADEINMPAIIGGRSISLISAAPNLDLDLSGATSLRVSLGQTALSGELVPANIDMKSLAMRGQFLPAGFSGSANGRDVRISDTHADPLYKPLIAELTAQFDGTRMTMSGPVRLADRETALIVADTALNIDLKTLNGEASAATRNLVFTPTGLQPKHLSDRVRDVFSNGRGALSGSADLSIRAGKLAGTGRLQARDFGFDTQRLGAVDGVSGNVEFSDLLALTTPPGQRVTIGQVKPGVPLLNGELVFQIIDGKQAKIERARWPFAGGTLDLLPSVWTIAGASDVLTVKATNIELSDLIEALSLPDIEAEGTVSGTFPLKLEDGNALIENAVLAADAKGGVIRYKGEAGKQAAKGDERVEAAFTALRDLRYTVLEIGVNGNLIDQVTVSARLLGKNPQVYGGAEFDFKINVSSRLAQLIRSGRSAASSKWLTELIATSNEGEEAVESEPFN